MLIKSQCPFNYVHESQTGMSPFSTVLNAPVIDPPGPAEESPFPA